MATPKQVKAWVDQASADFDASCVRDEKIAERHRRYWLQQAYEKAIKAYALVRWSGGSQLVDADFRKFFLSKHSPVTMIESVKEPLSKELHLLRREVRAFVNGLQSKVLLQIDATTPQQDPSKISYRYPFVLNDEYVAPSSFNGWDSYQGDEMAARAGVGQLLEAVRANMSKVVGRGPR